MSNFGISPELTEKRATAKSQTINNSSVVKTRSELGGTSFNSAEEDYGPEAVARRKVIKLREKEIDNKVKELEDNDKNEEEIKLEEAIKLRELEGEEAKKKKKLKAASQLRSKRKLNGLLLNQRLNELNKLNPMNCRLSAEVLKKQLGDNWGVAFAELRHMMQEMAKLEIPRLAREYLGLHTIRCMVVGDYRCGKSHYVSSVLCVLRQQFGIYTDYCESDTSVTQKIIEYVASDQLSMSNNSAPEFISSLLDSFGFESGLNWANVLIKALRGMYEEVDNTKKKDGFDKPKLNIDIEAFRKRNAKNLKEDEAIYSKMVLAVILVVDGRAIQNELDETGISGAWAIHTRMLYRLFTYLGYSPVIVVSNMDRIEGTIFWDNRVCGEFFSLSDVENDEKWRGIKKALIREGLPSNFIYPEVPITRFMDPVKQVLALRPLMDVTVYKCPKMLSQAMAVKEQKENKRPLTVVAVNAEEEYMMIEITLKNGRSMQHIQHAIAEELECDVDQIYNISVMKKGENDWISLLEKRKKDSPNIRKGDRIRFFRRAPGAEFDVVVHELDNDAVKIFLNENSTKSLEILYYKVTQNLPGVKNREDIKAILIKRLDGHWIMLTSKMVEKGGLVSEGRVGELKVILA